jgi:serine/threonine-protein kinase HipA
MAWEKTALDLAERAGLATPRRRYVVVEGRGVLVLERFDRRGSARLGYISAMTMLGARDGDARDYVELAEAFPEFASRPTVDLRELWRRIAFSVAVHNTDDHLRNHGFLRTGSGWALAPAFDVNPNPTPGARVTSIAGGRAALDEVEGLVAAAPYFRIRPGEVREQVRGVVDAVSTWREVAAANGIAARQLDLFAPIFDDRLRGLTAA